MFAAAVTIVLLMRDAIIKPMTIIVVALSALCASWLMGLVVGWKQDAPGYIAWALIPYAVLAVILLFAHSIRIDRAIALSARRASILIALGGPLLYFDAMFVNVDAQGALAVLMIPAIQTALGMAVAVVVVLWQWRIRRRAVKPAQ